MMLWSRPLVCSSNMTGYECRCEQSFAWSYNDCIRHGACDAIVGDTCGCITGLPKDGQQCQANTSQTGRPRTHTRQVRFLITLTVVGACVDREEHTISQMSCISGMEMVTNFHSTESTFILQVNICRGNCTFCSDTFVLQL